MNRSNSRTRQLPRTPPLCLGYKTQLSDHSLVIAGYPSPGSGHRLKTSADGQTHGRRCRALQADAARKKTPRHVPWSPLRPRFSVHTRGSQERRSPLPAPRGERSTRGAAGRNCTGVAEEPPVCITATSASPASSSTLLTSPHVQASGAARRFNPNLSRFTQQHGN